MNSIYNILNKIDYYQTEAVKAKIARNYQREHQMLLALKRTILQTIVKYQKNIEMD